VLCIDGTPADAAPAVCAGRDEPLDFRQAKEQAIESFERRYLARVLATARGNVSVAAKLANKERRALGKLLKKHGIDRRSYC
jgi:DNA-binding NtrC family response regulator